MASSPLGYTVLDLKPLVPYLSEYANSLSKKAVTANETPPFQGLFHRYLVTCVVTLLVIESFLVKLFMLTLCHIFVQWNI